MKYSAWGWSLWFCWPALAGSLGMTLAGVAWVRCAWLGTWLAVLLGLGCPYGNELE